MSIQLTDHQGPLT